ncbi:hypothetical protein BH10ACT6_BH10ACT6_12690 [soil metagenome]
MTTIAEMRAEVLAATGSASGLVDLAQRLVAKHPEYAAHLRNGIELDVIGQSHLEDQIRLLMAFSPDRDLWQQLSQRVDVFARDEWARKPFNSQWTYLNEDIDAIGEAFGWKGGSGASPDGLPFAQRLRMVNSTMANLSSSQIEALRRSLAGEPARSGGCFVATAVVYGNYDAVEVRVLRRWRDSYLRATTPGRLLIDLYYALSPALVRAVGGRQWFVVPVRGALNHLVVRLKRSGISDAPYSDR